MTIDENYDFWAACQENNVKHDDIDAVLLELTGENDEQGWHWLVSLIGGGFAYISGWCDYTGWGELANQNALITRFMKEL